MRSLVTTRSDFFWLYRVGPKNQCCSFCWYFPLVVIRSSISNWIPSLFFPSCSTSIPHPRGLYSAMKLPAKGKSCLMKIQNPTTRTYWKPHGPFSRSFVHTFLFWTCIFFRLKIRKKKKNLRRFSLANWTTRTHELLITWSHLKKNSQLQTGIAAGINRKSWWNMTPFKLWCKRSSWHTWKKWHLAEVKGKVSKIPRLQQCSSMTCIWQCLHLDNCAKFSMNTNQLLIVRNQQITSWYNQWNVKYLHPPYFRQTPNSFTGFFQTSPTSSTHRRCLGRCIPSKQVPQSFEIHGLQSRPQRVEFEGWNWKE